MANLRELKRRIKSIKNTAQITKAMELVAASKMRRAQTQALGGKDYTTSLVEVLLPIRNSIKEASHPLLNTKPSDKKLLILVGSNRGLVGSLNTNVFREIIMNKTDNTDFITVGKKATQLVTKLRKNLIASFELPEKVDFLFAKTIKKLITEHFSAGEYAEVSIRYPRFINTLKQSPQESLLLPISRIEIEKLVSETDTETKVLLEPNPLYILENFLNHYLEIQVYQVLLEALASEHSAQMVAMKSATDNANDLVGDLNLTYNGLRQANITSEILDISTAALSLN